MHRTPVHADTCHQASLPMLSTENTALNVTLPHEELHGAFSRTEQCRVPIQHTLHGRALQHHGALDVVPRPAEALNSELPSCPRCAQMCPGRKSIRMAR